MFFRALFAILDCADCIIFDRMPVDPSKIIFGLYGRWKKFEKKFIRKSYFRRFWEHLKNSMAFETHQLNEPKWGRFDILEAQNHVLRASKSRNTAHSCCIHYMHDIQHHMSCRNIFTGSQWVDLVLSEDVSQEMTPFENAILVMFRILKIGARDTCLSI